MAQAPGVPVLVELRVPPGTPSQFALSLAGQLPIDSFNVDAGFHPVPMSGGGGEGLAAAPQTYIVRGTVPEGDIPQLEQHPDVVRVWRDTQIAPFAQRRQQSAPARPRRAASRSANAAPARQAGATVLVNPSPSMAPCPIGVCDCDPHTAKGTMSDMATYLGASDVWAAGFRGTGIVVGVVDGGTLAVGRATPSKVPRVIGGWPTADWGTVAQWGEHGCMTSTDVLGMAPDAQIYDIRIADAPDPTGLISNALAGFQWAIDQHKQNGTPQVLTNSWGIFQQSWDPAYATDPNHPFTRKVVEAIAEGIVILFAAGNCGNTCPDGRCGPDNGPGRDIWGANGHPSVMTVGAVNRNEEFVGYSSVGPAALDPNKPDFCSVTHFAGYFPMVNPSEPADSGTSAATPIAAGVVALLKQAKPSATQDEIKNVLKSTAKDIGPPGWDQYSGAGIIRAKAAFDMLRGVVPPKKPMDDVGGKKLRDDAPAKKLQDDGPKKLQDDGGGKKLRDDVPPKKVRDDGPAKKLRDDRPKKLQDDGGAKKVRDDGPGKKLRDDGPGKKLRDDGPRKKFLDDAGVSALQAAQPTYFGYYGESPFILSTPHHAEVYQSQEAQYSEAELVAETEALMSGYENAIAQMEQQLEELRAAYASALEQHRAVIEAYQQGGGG